MTKANIERYIRMIRQLLHLEPCTDEEMTTHVNQIKWNLDNKWYYYWMTGLYHDGPWVQDLDLVRLHKDLRDNIKHNGLTAVKKMIDIFQTNSKCGPVHAAFIMFVWVDKWKMVHNQTNETFDPSDCPTVRAGKGHHYCTCELEQRTFMSLKPSLDDHPNPEDIKRFSTYS